MKHLACIAVLYACAGTFPVSAHVGEIMNEPDSVYLFSYATVPDAGRSGLKILNQSRVFINDCLHNCARRAIAHSRRHPYQPHPAGTKRIDRHVSA